MRIGIINKRTALLATVGMLPIFAGACVTGGGQDIEPRNDVFLTDPTATDTSKIYAVNEKIRPRDTLNIEIYRVPSLSGEYTVNSFGYAEFPLIGEKKVEGMTVEDLRVDLTQVYGEKYLENPTIIVDRKPAVIGKIVVDGQVEKPGIIELSEVSSLSEAIIMAGGISDEANARRILLIRDINGERNVGEFDLISIREKGGEDPFVQPNDVVYVDDATMRRTVGDVIRTSPLLRLFLF